MNTPAPTACAGTAAAIDQSARERENQLSHARIQQIAGERRALIRMRTYHQIGMGALIVAAIKLVTLAVNQVQDTRGRRISFILFAVVSLILGLDSYSLLLTNLLKGSFV